jgi:hypothetical protein
MTRNNFITIDLRQLTNIELFELSSIVNVKSEINVRGFTKVSELAKAHDSWFGFYPTLDEYLATFPQPKDNRTDGGC